MGTFFFSKHVFWRKSGVFHNPFTPEGAEELRWAMCNGLGEPAWEATAHSKARGLAVAGGETPCKRRESYCAQTSLEDDFTSSKESNGVRLGGARKLED